MQPRRQTGAVWAVVPLKSPDAAKSRLRKALDAGARGRLFFAMAQQMIRTLAHTPGIAGVAVVTASAEVEAFARHEGASVILQDRDAGTAEACRHAAAQLAGRADCLLMICGDIPLVRAEAVAELIDSNARAPLVTIVPDRKRAGTNALLCAPPGIVAPYFGLDSFQRHLAAVRSRGLEPRVVESDDLSLDIDDLEDLDELRRRLQANPVALPAALREALALTEEASAQ